MPLLHFMCDLKDVLQLSEMRFHSRQYRRAFTALKKRCIVDDDSVQVPGRRVWEKTESISVLIGLTVFIAMILLYVCREQIPEAPLKWACIISLIGLYLALIPAVFARLKQRRMTDAYLNGQIQLLSRRLQKLSPEQLEQADALLHCIPHYLFDEPCRPGDDIGCFCCGGVFPAEHFDWEESPDELLCPQCGQGSHLVYGTADVPVNEEILQILHNLFAEEN